MFFKVEFNISIWIEGITYLDVFSVGDNYYVYITNC